MSLNPRHKAFAAAIVSGLNQTEAYRKVYPKTSIAAARSSAATLLTNPSVRKYVEEAKEKAVTKAVLSRSERLELLSGLAKCEETFPKDRIAAVKVLNDMTGDNAPQKVEHSGSVSLVGVIEGIQSNAS